MDKRERMEKLIHDWHWGDADGTDELYEGLKDLFDPEVGKAVVVEFERKGETVTMKVVRMAEGLRGKGALVRKGKWSIESFGCPQIGVKTLYLWGGRRSGDRDVCVRKFSSEKKAEKYVRKMRALIDELNRERQVCGHLRSSIRGKTTRWCEECENESRRNA